MNKSIILNELAIGSTIYSRTFLSKQRVMGPFLSLKTVNMTFFNNRCAHYFFFPGLSVFFYSIKCLFFQLQLVVTNLYLTHL